MNFFNFSKGQAAMEFLTTYGWAFLVIILAIAGLSYFGVFDIGRILPTGCDFGSNPDLTCGDIFSLYGADPSGTFRELQITLTNTNRLALTIIDVRVLEKSLESTGAYCTKTTGSSAIQRSDGTGDGVTYTINPGQTVELDINLNGLSNCGLSQNIGQTKTFLVEFDYTLGNSAIEKIASGTLTTTVQ